MSSCSIKEKGVKEQMKAPKEEGSEDAQGNSLSGQPISTRRIDNLLFGILIRSWWTGLRRERPIAGNIS